MRKEIEELLQSILNLNVWVRIITKVTGNHVKASSHLILQSKANKLAVES